MFESPLYVAREYLYKNRIYKGRFPIATKEKTCPLGGYIPPEIYEENYVPITDLREELDEDEMILIELESPVIVKNEDGTSTEIKYLNTDTSTNSKLSEKGIHVTI
jgi:hypothetical protein